MGTGTVNSSTLDLAIELAVMGFNVFPCIPNSKKPAIDKFPVRATRKLHDVRQLWDRTDYNIGISTSKYQDTKALIVVDVDKKNDRDGFKTLELLDLCGFELPETLRQKTPSGGVHHIYWVDQPVKQGTDVLGAGLDIRSRGGYILGAGSRIDGLEYSFMNTGIQGVEKCPQWIIDKCSVSEAPILTVVPSLDVNLRVASTRAINFLRNQEIVYEGSRDLKCFWYACELKDLGLPPDEVESILIEEAKFEPQLTYEEIRAKVNSAFKNSQNAPGSKSVEAQFEPLPEVKGEHGKYNVEAPCDIDDDISNEDPGMIEGLLSHGGFSSLLGVPGAKKSFVALDMAFSVATGRPCLGMDTQQGGVLYMALEGLKGFRHRIRGLKKHYKLNNFPLAVSGESINLSDAHSKDGAKLIEIIKQAEKTIGEPIKFLVIDTLNRVMAGADENSTKDMTMLVGRLDYIRKEIGCHVMVVHHLGKDGSKGARGSSVLVGAVDTELRVANDTLRISKQKDMDMLPKIAFGLTTVEIGKNSKGKKVTTCVVTNFTHVKPFIKPAIEIDSHQEKLLEIVKSRAKVEKHLPPFIEEKSLVASLVDCQTNFGLKHLAEKSRSTKSMTFKRALEWLVDNEYLGSQGDLIWVKGD